MEWQPWVICIDLRNLLILYYLEKIMVAKAPYQAPVWPTSIEYLFNQNKFTFCKKHCKIYGSPKMTQELRK
ncbi:hypothetical protein B6A27_17330 [Anoxybacillus sp. UARK-01]|jgi:hypothetical protein|nr:hypothetical protein B6A27_17330 [Anoxybacillus sp. UARK-01]